MKGWALSLLIHGVAVALAALSVSSLTEEAQSGPSFASGGEGAGAAGSYRATLFMGEEKVPIEAGLPEVSPRGTLDASLGSPEPSLEPFMEDPPFSRVPFDVFALDPSGPAAARAPESESVSDLPAGNIGGVRIEAARRNPRAKPGVHPGLPTPGLGPTGRLGTGILPLVRKRESEVPGHLGRPGFAPVPGPGAKSVATPVYASLRIPQGLYSALRTPRTLGGLWRPVFAAGPRTAKPQALHFIGWDRSPYGLSPSGLSGTGIRIVPSGVSGTGLVGPRSRGGASSINGTEIRLRH